MVTELILGARFRGRYETVTSRRRGEEEFGAFFNVAPLNEARRRAFDRVAVGAGNRRRPVAPGRIGVAGVAAASLQFDRAFANPRDAPPGRRGLSVAHG